MKELSRSARAIQTSTTLAIDAMYKKMRAEGADVIGFGAGEPDFDTPEHIKQAGIAAIEANKTRYTPTPGIPELRQAVCDRLKADFALEYSPAQIVVASGAKHCLYIALQTVLNPGDEVILPAPFWVSYYELIKMAGGIPVVIQTSQKDNFKLTKEQLSAAVTHRTKALILNNPSNPTGMLYLKEELEDIGALCLKHDFYVIADEIYSALVYDGREFFSFASLDSAIKEHTILVSGVSKAYAMTGWRIGYSASNHLIAGVMSNYLSHSNSASNSIAQWAAVEALGGPQDSVELMRSAFETRRNYLTERMKALPGVSFLKPDGAFYVMMNIDSLLGKTLQGVIIRNAEDFARCFLEKEQVAVVPCTGFGAPNYVRWSYATSLENIREGMNRLEHFLSE